MIAALLTKSLLLKWRKILKLNSLSSVLSSLGFIEFSWVSKLFMVQAQCRDCPYLAVVFKKSPTRHPIRCCLPSSSCSSVESFCWQDPERGWSHGPVLTTPQLAFSTLVLTGGNPEDETRKFHHGHHKHSTHGCESPGFYSSLSLHKPRSLTHPASEIHELARKEPIEGSALAKLYSHLLRKEILLPEWARLRKYRNLQDSLDSHPKVIEAEAVAREETRAHLQLVRKL